MTDTPTVYHIRPGVTINSEDIRITPAYAGHVGYPQAATYTWGEFAGLAIEFGGYGDISAVDPYTGERFTLLDAWAYHPANHGSDGGASFLNAIRRLVDAIEADGWMRRAEQQHKDAGNVAP